LQQLSRAAIVILDAYEPNDNKMRYRTAPNELRNRAPLRKVEQDDDFEIYTNSQPHCIVSC
jgi:hypothetical protein